MVNVAVIQTDAGCGPYNDMIPVKTTQKVDTRLFIVHVIILLISLFITSLMLSNSQPWTKTHIRTFLCVFCPPLRNRL